MNVLPATKPRGHRKFFIYSTFGELLDVAIQLKLENEEVLLYVPNEQHKQIGEGIVPKADNWHRYLGEGWIWIIDGTETADLQDWLRSLSEKVVGTNKEMADYENDRQKGQAWFKKAGFKQPYSENFLDFDEAIDFIRENTGTKYILKQNGDAPKRLNHKGKFDDGSDMIYHLEELKKSWNERECGEINFDLMEIVEGTELAASAFFNGHDWLRDKDGKVTGFLNFEEKKEADGDRGETTGETGTTFLGVDESNTLFRDIILRPSIVAELKRTKYQGVFDINGSLTEEGYVAFEPTSRFGIPATSYEFIAGLNTSTADLLETLANGDDDRLNIHKGIGMVIVGTAKPYPIEADIEDTATSLGERLWPLEDGAPSDDFTPDQLSQLHLQNFHKDDTGYKVATKDGYLFTVSGRGDDIPSVREDIMNFMEDNLYIAGLKYRTDIGARIEDFIEDV